MIKTLEISGHPKVADRVFHFGIGVTKIHGPNESGKSTILEMIDYALHGVDALRRPASDYKKLAVRMVWEMKGHEYEVIRSPKITQLNKDKLPLATGTKPVNQAIAEQMGYGHKVFKIANYCKQRQATALTDSLMPAQRKALIDQTIGLTAIDEVIAEITKELTDHNRERASLENFWANRTPVAPQAPDTGGLGTAELKGMIADCEVKRARKLQLSARLGVPLNAPAAPTAPEGKRPDTSRTQALTEQLHEHNRLLAIAQMPVPAVPFPPEPPAFTETREQLQASVEARKEAARLLRQRELLKEPQYGQLALDEIEKQWDLVHKCRQRDQLLAAGDFTCPDCGATHPLQHEGLKLYADLPAVPPTPPITMVEVNRERALLPHVAQREELLERAQRLEQDMISGDAEKLITLQNYEVAASKYDLQVRNQAEIQAKVDLAKERLKEFPNCSAELEEIRTAASRWWIYDSALKSFEAALEGHQKAVEQRKLDQEELATLDDDYGLLLEGFRELLSQLTVYDTQVKAYEAEKQRYDEEQTRLEDLVKVIETKTAGRQALADLKVAIKSHVLPSLNATASYLMNRMTNGARASVLLDDEFKVTVDGLAVEAMSGSGEVVANLALRLALGQVLTNSMFSVFMGDEMDAEFDLLRSKGLMEALNHLKGSVQQIFVVSHTPPEHLNADHEVAL